MSDLRLFLAIPLNREYHELVAHFYELHKEKKIRWIDPGNLHVTTLFLGKFPENNTEALNTSLDDHFKREPALSLEYYGFHYAPKLKKARMIWLSFKNSPGFDALIHRTFSHLKKFYKTRGVSFDLKVRNKNTPHVTLARFKPFDARKKSFLEQPSFAAPPLYINEISLYSSRLHPSGAQYSVLKTFSLEGSGD